ncbi:MAG TPA: OmpA family protein [Pyrinomonadaceae bacterium]|nr:OmpA family protein [Pyrinomonadaceae bacterium]
MRRKKETSIEHESHLRDRWLISYADLVTLLLALFIVMYAASDHERARQIAESFSAENTGGSGILPGSDAEKDERDKFEQKLLANPVLIQKTKTRQTKVGLVVSLSEAGFFAPGEAAINAEADAVITTLAESLQNTDALIRIEGHTDSTPIYNTRYPSNWELSTARASSVLARLIERGIAPARLSAAGYAGFQPIADNSTPEGRAQNRRVDVVILNR